MSRVVETNAASVNGRTGTPAPFLDLYRKHRPRKLSQVVGQEDVVKALQALVEKNSIPHAILFTGPSGCGKTTLARILRRPLKCHKRDFKEINAAESRGIDTVREIGRGMTLAAWGGATKVYLLDEVACVSPDGQRALLKMLEDPPSHVYFMLATTDPQRVIAPIKTRCLEVAVRSLTVTELVGLVDGVAKAEGVELTLEELRAVAECADGSARTALVLLGKVIHLPGGERLPAVVRAARRPAFDLVKMLMGWVRARWPDVAKFLRELDPQEGLEPLRCAVLTCAKNELLKATSLDKAKRAALILDEFKNPYFSSTAAADLARNCWFVMGEGSFGK